MLSISASKSTSPNGLLDVLRTWLRSRTHEFASTAEGLPDEAGLPEAHPNASIRVLVVDDYPMNLVLTSALLQSKGLVPLLAADGAEAVALACEMHFDLILMDLQMPILDGLKATVAIRRFEKAHSRPAMPVVAYTSTKPGARVLTACGMSDSLVKPCQTHELEDCLVRWCPTYLPAASAAAIRPAAGHR